MGPPATVIIIHLRVCPQDSPSHQSLAEILFSGNMFVVKPNGGKKEATNLLESKEVPAYGRVWKEEREEGK